MYRNRWKFLNQQNKEGNYHNKQQNFELGTISVQLVSVNCIKRSNYVFFSYVWCIVRGGQTIFFVDDVILWNEIMKMFVPHKKN